MDPEDVAPESTSPMAAGERAAWQPSPPYTVGLEEEVMLLDPETWALAQRADRLLAVLGDDLAGSCSAETHAAALELTTSPHATVGGAVAELGRLRAQLARDAQAIGLATAAAGMHPGEMAEDPQVSPAGRYQLVHRTMRGIARREPTFALHVHVGVADPESAIRLLNRLRAHLPLLLALSASSPLWRGQATGLASNRTILFQAFPRTGLPRRFEGYADWVSHRRPAHALGRDPRADVPVVGRTPPAAVRHRRGAHHGRATAARGDGRAVRARPGAGQAGARGGLRAARARRRAGGAGREPLPGRPRR